MLFFSPLKMNKSQMKHQPLILWLRLTWMTITKTNKKRWNFIVFEKVLPCLIASDDRSSTNESKKDAWKQRFTCANKYAAHLRKDFVHLSLRVVISQGHSTSMATMFTALRAMFYLLKPSETYYERIEDVPDYVVRVRETFAGDWPRRVAFDAFFRRFKCSSSCNCWNLPSLGIVERFSHVSTIHLVRWPRELSLEFLGKNDECLVTTSSRFDRSFVDFSSDRWNWRPTFGSTSTRGSFLAYRGIRRWPTGWRFSAWIWDIIGFIEWPTVTETKARIRFFHRFSRSSVEVNLFWAAHQTHHSAENYNLSTALRQGAVQGYFSWIFYLPLALFVPPQIFLVHAQMNLLYQFWIHTDVIGNLGPFEYILNTPSHHRVHHGRNPYCIDKNYAGVFIIWDRLFGTFAAERENEQIAYGLIHPIKTFDPIDSQVIERSASLIRKVRNHSFSYATSNTCCNSFTRWKDGRISGRWSGKVPVGKWVHHAWGLTVFQPFGIRSKCTIPTSQLACPFTRLYIFSTPLLNTVQCCEIRRSVPRSLGVQSGRTISPSVFL